MLKNGIKRLWLGAAVLLLILGNAALTYADTAISGLEITFQHQYDERGKEILEPAVLADGAGYTVESVSWSSDRSQWKPGERVTAGIHLAPEDGYEFSYYYENDKIHVNQGKFLTYWRESDGGMFLKAAYYPVVQLGQTEQAGWSDAERTTASWKAVPYATAYQVKLYHGSGEYITTLTLRGTSVDLSSYVPAGGSYYYEVRAISKDSEDAAYRKSGAYTASERSVAEESGAAAAGGWYQTAEGWRYSDSNGTEAADGWRYIGGVWYYFDSDGYAATGWRELNGKWYYMNQDGQMHTGWLELDGETYYMDSTGAMAAGWYQMSPSVWYYFEKDGRMVKDAEVDGYRLGFDGIME